jgi:hypothetical protein
MSSINNTPFTLVASWEDSTEVIKKYGGTVLYYYRSSKTEKYVVGYYCDDVDTVQDITDELSSHSNSHVFGPLSASSEQDPNVICITDTSTEDGIKALEMMQELLKVVKFETWTHIKNGKESSFYDFKDSVVGSDLVPYLMGFINGIIWKNYVPIKYAFVRKGKTFSGHKKPKVSTSDGWTINK